MGIIQMNRVKQPAALTKILVGSYTLLAMGYSVVSEGGFRRRGLGTGRSI